MSKPFLIAGASMPRSGHHFLHRIMMSYWGDQFGYCSFYYPWEHDYFKSCCENVPCTKYTATDLRVFFQKSHDFDLTDPTDTADLNIVQVREPIARVFSNFELHVKGNPQNNSLGGFRQFAQREYYYYVAFWAKWIAQKPAKTAVLRYEDLKENPFNAIATVIQNIGWTVDADRLNAAIAEQQATRGGKSKYVSKDIRQSPFYEQEWAETYATNIRRACPGYDEHFGIRAHLVQTPEIAR